MILTINAQVTVDLSHLGKSPGTVCQGTLTYNGLGQPDTVRLVVDAPTVNAVNAVLNQNLGSKLVGTLVSIVDGHGRLVKSKLAALTKVEPGQNDLTLTFMLDRAETTLPAAVDHPVRTWSFALSNVHLHLGDERVDHPAPQVAVPPPA